MAKSDSSRRTRLRAAKGRKTVPDADSSESAVDPYHPDQERIQRFSKATVSAWHHRASPIAPLARKEATKVAETLQDMYGELGLIHAVVSTAEAALRGQSSDYDLDIAITLQQVVLQRLNEHRDQVARLMVAAGLEIPAEGP